jgi:hypothetical protein
MVWRTAEYTARTARMVHEAVDHGAVARAISCGVVRGLSVISGGATAWNRALLQDFLQIPVLAVDAVGTFPGFT